MQYQTPQFAGMMSQPQQNIFGANMNPQNRTFSNPLAAGGFQGQQGGSFNQVTPSFGMSQPQGGIGLQGMATPTGMPGMPGLGMQNQVQTPGMGGLSGGFTTSPLSTMSQGFINNQPGFQNNNQMPGGFSQPIGGGIGQGILNQNQNVGLSQNQLGQNQNTGFMNQQAATGGFLNQGMNQQNLINNRSQFNTPFQQNQFLASGPLSTTMGLQKPLMTQMTTNFTNPISMSAGFNQYNQNQNQNNFQMQKSFTQPLGMGGYQTKQGTGWVKWQFTRDRDGQSMSAYANFINITAMPQFNQKSIEELRLEDYKMKKQGITGMGTGIQQNIGGMQQNMNATPGAQPLGGIQSGFQNNSMQTGLMGMNTGLLQNQNQNQSN